MKKLFTVGILALCSLTIASAKNYELTLSSVTKVGTLQLKPGQYTLKVDGDKAVFTYLETSKQFTTQVKVEATDKKFDTTRVDASKADGVDVVKDIELGGSKTRLEFGM
jgi:VCBS repeat-containing protein